MISVPLFVRILLVKTILIVLVATSSALPAEAGPVRDQVQKLNSPSDPITQKRARATGKWSIRVQGWSKNVKRGDQARIDRCRATLWWGSFPTARAKRPTWLAGHNYCGFWRWDKWLHVGSRFSVKNPKGKLRKYEVYDRAFINRKSGSSDGLIHGDITLQTCSGTGMTFVYARLRR